MNSVFVASYPVVCGVCGLTAMIFVQNLRSSSLFLVIPACSTFGCMVGRKDSQILTNLQHFGRFWSGFYLFSGDLIFFWVKFGETLACSRWRDQGIFLRFLFKIFQINPLVVSVMRYYTFPYINILFMYIYLSI